MIYEEGLQINYLSKLFLLITLGYSGITLYLIRDYIFPIDIMDPDFLAIFMLCYFAMFGYAVLNFLIGLTFLSSVIKILCYAAEMLLMLNLFILGYFVSINDQKNIDAILIDIKYIFAPMGLLGLALKIAIEKSVNIKESKLTYMVLPTSYRNVPDQYSAKLFSS